MRVGDRSGLCAGVGRRKPVVSEAELRLAHPSDRKAQNLVPGDAVKVSATVVVRLDASGFGFFPSAGPKSARQRWRRRQSVAGGFPVVVSGWRPGFHRHLQGKAGVVGSLTEVTAGLVPVGLGRSGIAFGGGN